MDIKETLKRANIPLTLFSEKLDLSRPTLYEYINQFEETGYIKNEKYNIIFNNIFNTNKKIDREHILQTCMRYSILLKRDEYNRTFELGPEQTDRLMNIFNKLKTELLNSENQYSNMFIFIERLLYSQNNKLIDLLIEYFLYLNWLVELDLTDERKIFFSHISNFFESFALRKLKYSEKLFNLFFEKRYKVANEQAKNNYRRSFVINKYDDNQSIKN